MNALITGGTGFVGSAIAAHFASEGIKVRISSRSAGKKYKNIECVQVAGLSEQTDWREALFGIDVVVHTAARVHRMKEKGAGIFEAYKKTNVEGTLALAKQAAVQGVSRFIFMSSIKVNGEMTSPNRPFRADDDSVTVDLYGVSKLEAENELKKIAKNTGMELVIIRPPLVYGPGVKANFETMMKSIVKGIPLPLGKIHNKRSLVYLPNLVDLVHVCIKHPDCAGKVFLVSDDQDVSTTVLLEKLAYYLKKKIWLIPVPAKLLNLLALLAGQHSKVQRLCEFLQVDISKTKNTLHWNPPYSLDEGLQKTAEYYLKKTV